MAPPQLKTMAVKQARRLRRKLKLKRKYLTASSEQSALMTLAHSGPACLPQNDPRWLVAWRE